MRSKGCFQPQTFIVRQDLQRMSHVNFLLVCLELKQGESHFAQNEASHHHYVQINIKQGLLETDGRVARCIQNAEKVKFGA